MRLLRLILLLFAVALVGVNAVLIFYYGFYLQEYQEVDVDFLVESGIGGFNADTDALHFGTMSPGGTGRRNLTVTPSQDSRLVIKFSGEAAPFLSVSQNDILIPEGEQVKMVFKASIPPGTAEKNYTGVTKFYFFRP